MPASVEGQFVVALSSRALFDFEEENQVFEDQDDSAYMRLQLERSVFARGRPPFHYLKPLGANLFLSANEADVRAALEGGFLAALQDHEKRERSACLRVQMPRIFIALASVSTDS